MEEDVSDSDALKAEECHMQKKSIWDMRIKRQLISIFLLISGIPILTLSVFMYFESSRFNTQNMQSMLEYLATQYEEKLSESFSKIEEQMNVIALTGSMRQAIQASRRGEQLQQKQEEALELIFNSAIYSHEEIEMALYIDYNEEMKSYGRIVDSHSVKNRLLQYFEEEKDDLLDSELFERCRSQKGRPVWALIETDKTKQIVAVKSLIQLGCPESQGYLIFFLKTGQFMPFQPEDLPREDAALVVLNDEAQVMMGACGEKSTLEMEVGQRLDSNHVQRCISSNRLLDNGWELNCLIPRESFLSDMRMMGMIAILIGLLLLVAAFFSLDVYASRLNQRFDLLLKKMKRAKSGDLRVKDHLQGTDELKKLDDGFDDMLLDLEDFISENYIQQLEKREAQLRMLQFQINPHFLYNTLASMQVLSMQEGNTCLTEMIQHLAAMFRYSISESDKDLVTVEEELHHVKDYIYLQKIRFEDRLDVRYEIEDGLLQCKMMRFVLQPIVENAIRHGLNEGEGVIIIRAHSDDEDILFTIQDDGNGIPPERLEQIEQELEKEHVKDRKIGIGLYNVHSRLRLRYGKKYGVKLASGESGTIVEIRVPGKEK